MDDRDRCRGCGKKRPTDAPGGLCPACLLRAGLAGGDPAVATSAPGLLVTLAETIGDLPRVLLRDTDPGTGPGPVVRPCSPEMPARSDHFARLQLLGEVARGGMGAVLKGRDTDLGRDLAVKILLEQHRENPELIRRFIEEAQISGQLQHPGVVPVYELGALADHRPYFAMKLVKGRTLAVLLEERASAAEDQPRLIGIFEQVCLTMAYAHARGVVHRDLKPSNIMVGSFGEVQVMDWGLAKVLQQGGAVDDETAGRVVHETVIQTARSGTDADASQSGSVMGTPAYMPPEQASGEVDRLDERADVFALGSILCEVLTGLPAFTGRTAGEIQRKAARGDLREAFGRLDACGPGSELVALAKDCLACEPEDRPRNAGGVTERLTAYLAGVQERLRMAELARVEAQARAEEEAKQRVLADALAHEAQARAQEERHRRRLQLGLAAAILALTTVAALGSTAYLHQRQTRAAQVDLALSETTLLHDQARKAPDDLGRWQATREAIRRVELALGDGGDLPARHRLDALRREVEAGAAAAHRDRELLEALADIRLAQLDLGPGATDAAYAEAFRRAELDVDVLPPAEAAARLRARPAAVLMQMVGYLDTWTTIRRGDEQPAERWRRPLAVARAADPDPDRDRLRAMVEREDLKTQAEALHALSEARQGAELSPTSALLLAFALKQAGDLPGAVAVLERAAQRHPGDVWLNYNLAEFFSLLPNPRRQEAVRYYTAARALRPETAHDLAHLLDQMGRGEDAIATFRELVRVRPSSAKDLACFGKTLQAHGGREEARETLDRAIAAARESIRRRPDDAGYHNTLASTLAVRGDEEGAIAAYRAALRIKPGHTAAVTNLVAGLRARGDQDGAIAVLRTAIRARPDHAPSHHALSHALQEKGDYDGALVAIREAIRLSPDRSEYRRHLSELLETQGLDDTIAVTPASVGIKTDDFAAHIALGSKLHDGGNLKGAIAEFRAAVRLKPEDADARDSLGLLLLAQRDPDAAIVELREAIRLVPEHGRAHRNLGDALKAKGNVDGAIAAYREAIRYSPGNLSIRSQLRDALKAKGYSSATRAAYFEATGIKTDDLADLLAVGERLRDANDLVAALAVFREAVQRKPDSAAAHRHLGYTLRVKGETDKAVAECREAVRLDPGDSVGHNVLGLVLKAKGDREGAIAEYRTAIWLTPDDYVPHGNLALALREKKDLDGAIGEFREVIRCNPGRYQAYGNLGGALRQKGDLEGAIAALREQLRLKPDLASALDALLDALKLRKQRTSALPAMAFASFCGNPRLAYALEAVMAPLMARVQPDERIAVCDSLIRDQPDHVGAHRARARCLIELGRKDQAATDFARALSLIPQPKGLWQVEDPSGVYPAAVADPEVFEWLTWFRPDDRNVWIARVRDLARKRQWQEAVVVASRLNALEPPDQYSWNVEAILRSWAGDGEGYRRICRKMIERFGSTTDESIARQTVFCCLLQPDAIPDLHALEPLLDRFLGPAAVNRSSFSILSAGFYDYRAGHFSSAIERLRPIPGADVKGQQDLLLRVLASVVRAMAYQKTGQEDEARRQLAATEAFAKGVKFDPDREGILPSGWSECLRYYVYRREAEQLME